MDWVLTQITDDGWIDVRTCSEQNDWDERDKCVSQWCCHSLCLHSSAADCVIGGYQGLLRLFPARLEDRRQCQWMCVCVHNSLLGCGGWESTANRLFWQVLSSGQTGEGKCRKCLADTHTRARIRTEKPWAFEKKNLNLACISGAEHCLNVPELSSRLQRRGMWKILWLFSPQCAEIGCDLIRGSGLISLGGHPDRCV